MYLFRAPNIERLEASRSIRALVHALGYAESSDDKFDKEAALAHRKKAALALGRIGDPLAVGPLISVLNNRTWGVQAEAAQALGRIGDRRAVRFLFDALKDDDPGLRGDAAEALGKIGDIRAVQPLIAALTNSNSRWISDSTYYARRAAADALLAMYPRLVGRAEGLRILAARDIITKTHIDYFDDCEIHSDSGIGARFPEPPVDGGVVVGEGVTTHALQTEPPGGSGETGPTPRWVTRASAWLASRSPDTVKKVRKRLEVAGVVAIFILFPVALLVALALIGDTSRAVPQIAAGNGHTCVLTTPGGTTRAGVRCWGVNTAGQLGHLPMRMNGVPVGTQSSVPNAVSWGWSWPKIVDISASYDHTCVLTEAGGVKCWGKARSGQLGNGLTTNEGRPVDVVGLSSGVAAVSAGSNHTCALTKAGGVKCWGDNSSGQLGDGGTASSSVPVDVVGLSSGVAAISSGHFHTCAVTTSGGVKCWGQNDHGQLGRVSTANGSLPDDVVGLSSGVAGVSAGGSHNCALTAAGGVKCWGRNYSGQLGNSTDTDDVSVPVEVRGHSSGVAAVSAGIYHTCVLTTSGGANCWGNNKTGELGNGTTKSSSTPTTVTGFTSGVAAILGCVALTGQ